MLSESDRQTLGFVVVETDERGTRGALLVTDLKGLPVAFRVTTRVCLTRLQRILHGAVLERHIVELIGKALFDSQETVPSVILVEEEMHLGLSEAGAAPVVWISRRARSEGTDADRLRLLPAYGEPDAGLAVRVSGSSEGDGDQLCEWLGELAQGVSLLEPFLRVHGAMAELTDERTVDEQDLESPPGQDAPC